MSGIGTQDMVCYQAALFCVIKFMLACSFAYHLPICLHGNILEAFQVLEAFKAQHNGKCFNLSHRFWVIKDEEKFKAQYAALKSRGGKQAVEEVGDGEPAGPRGRPTPRRRASGMRHQTP